MNLRSPFASAGFVPSRGALWPGLLVAALVLAGCDARSGTAAAPPPATAATPSVATPPTTVAEVLALDADAAGRSALVSSARDVELEPALRVVALRRLEELGAPETAQVAAELAREPPGLVRDNAVATLARLNATDAIAELDPDAQALARAIAERAR